MAEATGEMPEGTPAGQAPAPMTVTVEPADVLHIQSPAEAAAGQDPEDDFDKERALATIRKLRETEKAAKTQRQELDQLRAQLTAFEDAKLSQEERIAKQIETLQTQLADKERREAELTKRVQEQALRFAVVTEAAKLQIVDPDAAYKLLDLSEVERDEDGNATNLGKVLKDLVKAKPYLVAQQPTPAASPTNPAREDRQAATDPVNLPFDPPRMNIWDMGRQGLLGGGIHYAGDVETS